MWKEMPKLRLGFLLSFDSSRTSTVEGCKFLLEPRASDSKPVIVKRCGIARQEASGHALQSEMPSFPQAKNTTRTRRTETIVTTTSFRRPVPLMSTQPPRRALHNYKPTGCRNLQRRSKIQDTKTQLQPQNSSEAMQLPSSVFCGRSRNS